jgi:hypothetical protein
LIAQLKILATRLLLSDAVLVAIGGKVWQIVALPVTIALILGYLSPETQGFYYTFLSLVALQTFLELGLHLAVLATASHESSAVGLGPKGELTGPMRAVSRIVSLGGFALSWYAILAACFALLVGPLGAFFLLSSSASTAAWLGPWAALVCISAVQLIVSPFNYMLEGLGQVASIYRMRLYQMMFSSAALWTALLADAGLWAAACASAAALVVNLAYFAFRYPLFFRTRLSSRDGEKIQWATEIWPMQWRLAIQGVVGYFLYYLFNPIMFYYHGPAEAGRVGMTVQLLAAIQSVGLIWIQTKAYTFGNLVATGQRRALHEEWFRSSVIAVFACVLGNTLLMIAVVGISQSASQLADRLLPVLPTLFLALAYAAGQFIQCMAAYTRAHKEEPFAIFGSVCGLAAGIAVWWFGRSGGALGAAAAYFAVYALVTLPGVTLLWLRAKRRLDTQPLSCAES